MPRSPFPGMDPYLEAPDLWQDVHTRLMTVFAEQLTPRLAPGYVAEVHTRLVIDRLMDEQPQISRPPRPALTLADSDWASQLLAKAALGNG